MSKSELQIFPDAARNKAFLAQAKKITLSRASEGIITNRNATSLTSRAVQQVNSNAIYHSQNTMNSAVAELNKKESFTEVLRNHIENKLLNGKDEKDYTYQDHIIAVTFAYASLNKSNLTLEAKTTVLDKIKKAYSKYDPTFIDQLDGSIKTLEGYGFPAEISTLIVGQSISLKEMITKKVPADQFITVCEQLGIDLQPQYDALEMMMGNAAAEDITKENEEKYFKLQYGNTPKEQLIAFIREFGKTPLDVLADEDINQAFVTKRFIKTWEKIQGSDPRRSTILRLSFYGQGLHRFPRNIGKLTALIELVLSENQLISLPSEIGNLTKLEYLNLSHNKLRSLPSGMEKLKALKSLNLSHNELTALPKGIFQSLTKLNILILPKTIPQAELNHAGIRKEAKIIKA